MFEATLVLAANDKESLVGMMSVVDTVDEFPNAIGELSLSRVEGLQVRRVRSCRPFPKPLTLMRRLLWLTGHSVNFVGTAIFHSSRGMAGFGFEK